MNSKRADILRYGLGFGIAMFVAGCVAQREPPTLVPRDSPLVHGARVKVMVAELGDSWLQGVLSLEGSCLVWLQRPGNRPRYMAIERVTAAQVSDVQETPRNGWPAGILGAVAGEVWSDVEPGLLRELQARCAPPRES